MYTDRLGDTPCSCVILLLPTSWEFPNSCVLVFTGTFKLKKNDYKKQGFSPTVVEDEMYFLNPKSGEYERIDKTVYESICSGRIRLWFSVETLLLPISHGWRCRHGSVEDRPRFGRTAIGRVLRYNIQCWFDHCNASLCCVRDSLLRNCLDLNFECTDCGVLLKKCLIPASVMSSQNYCLIIYYYYYHLFIISLL